MRVPHRPLIELDGVPLLLHLHISAHLLYHSVIKRILKTVAFELGPLTPIRDRTIILYI